MRVWLCNKCSDEIFTFTPFNWEQLRLSLNSQAVYYGLGNAVAGIGHKKPQTHLYKIRRQGAHLNPQQLLIFSKKIPTKGRDFSKGTKNQGAILIALINWLEGTILVKGGLVRKLNLGLSDSRSGHGRVLVCRTDREIFGYTGHSA